MAALLIPLNMDYALTIVELPIVLFTMFCIFMKPYLRKAHYISAPEDKQSQERSNNG